MSVATALVPFVFLLLSDQELVLEYERRARVVGQQLTERKARARKHMMALYRLTKGGLGPWLVEPFGDLVARERALRRMVDRDLVEIQLYAEERQHLAELRARVPSTGTGAGQGASASAVRTSATQTLAPFHVVLFSPTEPKGHNMPPVVGPFGYYQETRLRLFRRGVLLGVAVGGAVYAPTSGRVVHTGPLPELGEVVVISPEENVFVVVGHLAHLKVAMGDAIEAGRPLGRADRGSILVEVRHGATPLDPAPFLRHAGQQTSIRGSN